MPDDPRVQQLLDELLDSEATPEDVCGSHPELLPLVRHRWRQVCQAQAELDALFPPMSGEGGGGPATPPDATALPAIPGYDVEAVLGVGGMGVVFRARHLRLNRVVALKMVLAGAYAGSRERERFQREAEAVAALRHPNVVQVYDVGDADGRPFFTMEYVEGGSLARRLAGTPLPARAAAEMLATLARAVQAAHTAGIVHRDMKPENVLLTGDGTPKIGDFGLARRVDGGAGPTVTGTALGTPSYMAPEQARGEPGAAGPAADIYALGAVLYELLTGRPPFRAATAAETIWQLLSRDAVRPSRLNGTVPRDLETVCLKCLHKTPRLRYATAAALADDLDRWRRGEAILARPEGRLRGLARTVRRHPTATVGLAGGLLLAAAVGGGGLWLRAARAAAERAQDQLDRLDRDRRDREFLARLDAIHLDRVALVNGRFNMGLNLARSDRDYEAAFREAGFGGVGEEPDVVAARVGASAVRDALLAAIDDWAVCACDRRRLDWVLEVACRADRDPARSRDRFRDPAAWVSLGATSGLPQAALAAEASVPLLLALGQRLKLAGGDAVPFLKRVQRDHPGDFWANLTLANALSEKMPGEAIRYYQAALAVRPEAAVAHNNLGIALADTDRLDDAVEQFLRAVRLAPGFAQAHANLGIGFYIRGRYDEAVGRFGEATRLDPQSAKYHSDLGIVLAAAGRPDKAIDEFQQAIRLDAKYFDAYAGLGDALIDRGRPDEAIDRFQQALRLDPTSARACTGWGRALADTGRLGEAIDLFRRALRLDPKYGPAHHNLGVACTSQGRPDEAIDHLRQALRLDPKSAAGYYAYGRALAAAGNYHDAEAATRRGLELLAPDHPSRAYTAEQLRYCERMSALAARLPAVLEGKDKPADPAECLDLAEICRVKALYAAAARLSAAAFVAAPPLAEDPAKGRRYNAACFAAQAGCGRGADAAGLGEPERARWRGKAREWLRADLAAWGKALDRDPAAVRGRLRENLSPWSVDPDLAGLRDAAELDKLPADERKDCLALWGEVGAVLGRAR